MRRRYILAIFLSIIALAWIQSRSPFSDNVKQNENVIRRWLSAEYKSSIRLQNNTREGGWLTDTDNINLNHELSQQINQYFQFVDSQPTFLEGLSSSISRTGIEVQGRDRNVKYELIFARDHPKKNHFNIHVYCTYHLVWDVIPFRRSNHVFAAEGNFREIENLIEASAMEAGVEIRKYNILE